MQRRLGSAAAQRAAHGHGRTDSRTKLQSHLVRESVRPCSCQPARYAGRPPNRSAFIPCALGACHGEAVGVAIERRLAFCLRSSPCLCVSVVCLSLCSLPSVCRRLRSQGPADDRSPVASRPHCHHRHASRRSARLLRQPRCRDAELRSGRARRSAGARRDGACADHAAVARLDLHRPLSGAARHP